LRRIGLTSGDLAALTEAQFMLWLDFAAYEEAMEGLNTELRSIRFMPMADSKSVDKEIKRLRGQMERLEAWFYGAETKEDKLRRWRRTPAAPRQGSVPAGGVDG
jgi:hypothetical protein